jgi:type 1 glutamine amidotransferase
MGRIFPVAPSRASAAPRFRVLALYENGGHHVAFSARARVWLDQLAADSNFRVDYITNTDSIDETFLARYQVFLQLDYAPYAWKPAAVAAFQRYISLGTGGWIGLHHASLLGEFDGYPMWSWFSTFMGGIRWKDYIARFASATVHVEDQGHPVMKGIPDSFVVRKEEWYTWDKSPRLGGARVLADVDEASYRPDTSIKMGDHPVIWSNPSVRARNVYIFMGHDPILFDDTVYTHILRNAIFWTAGSR